MRPRTPEFVRFWPKVEKTETCWLWTASDNGQGYGHFYLAGGEKTYAHRWSYEQAFGPIPDGLYLDHLCRIPRCVRPDHLEAVSHRVNCLRGNGYRAAHARDEDCGGVGCKNCRRFRSTAEFPQSTTQPVHLLSTSVDVVDAAQTPVAS